MRVAVISANLGSYENAGIDGPWPAQVVPAGVTVEIHRLTDATFHPRRLAMTSRLQCGIPKMFAWQLVPDRDVYVWVDASRALGRLDTVAWFLDQLGSAELLLLRHPERRTIREEYEFMKQRMARRGERYLTSRYRGEWLDDQFEAVSGNGYRDDALYASTAFAYRNTPHVRTMLKEWWYFKSRYLTHDQLALPYVVRQSRCDLRVIDENIYKSSHLPIVRGLRR